MYRLLFSCLVGLSTGIATIGILAVAANAAGAAEQESDRPRVIVTTDGEVDDVDSFIRFLLYTNEFDIEGLVYSSSQWHYAGDGKGTLFTSEMPNTAERYGERTDLRWPGTEWMQDLIGKYGEVHHNLLLHDRAYPTPEELLQVVRVGNITFEGEMERDTEGSDLIKEVLLDGDPAPVYLQAWGGTNTIARALKSIEDTYRDTPQWEDVYESVSKKAVIYTILDQDATYRKYIAPRWPDVRILYNSAQFWSFAYPWPEVVPDSLQTYLSGPWFAENIKFDHGPLLAEYYLWGDGRMIPGDAENRRGLLEETRNRGRTQYDFISEGDSPAFLYLLDVGLRSPENPSYGGWGGRLVQSQTVPSRWEDGDHVADYNPYTETLDTTFPQTRWIPALQRDFAARADWTVKPYDEANHPPVVSLQHAADLEVSPGQTVSLHASADDPDGDAVTFRWWQYGEMDSYPGLIDLQGADSAQASLVIPDEAPTGTTIHMIVEVTDAGDPPLTRYARAIATVSE